MARTDFSIICEHLSGNTCPNLTFREKEERAGPTPGHRLGSGGRRPSGSGWTSAEGRVFQRPRRPCARGRQAPLRGRTPWGTAAQMLWFIRSSWGTLRLCFVTSVAARGGEPSSLVGTPSGLVRKLGFLSCEASTAGKPPPWSGMHGDRTFCRCPQHVTLSENSTKQGKKQTQRTRKLHFLGATSLAH